MGDLLQLPPVRATYIFDDPKERKLANAADALQLWKQFHVYILKHNHRQGEGNRWANVLNEIREAKGMVNEDTENMLQSRLVEVDEKNELTTCHVFYENDNVAAHNTKKS